jgi:signal transduction histidine kinase
MKKIFTNSLLKRILIYQIIIGIVPLLFIGLSSIFTMSRTLQNNAERFQEETVRQGTLYINLVMDDVESLTANLSGIDEVNNALSNSSGETPYEKLVTQAKIGYILSGYTSLKGLVSIDLFSGQNAHYHVGETLNATNINEDILQKLYMETQASTDFVNWSGIEENINMDSEYSSVITASKILSAKKTTDNENSTQGLLVVSFDPAVFDKVFGEATDQSSYSIVLDKQNRIVYHPDSQLIGHTLADELAQQILSQKSGSFTKIIDGKQMLVVFDGTQKGNWTLTRFIPLQNLLSEAHSMTVLFVILLLLSLSVTAVFGQSMSRQIVKPIRTVTDTFRKLQSGNFSSVSKLKLVHHDEIGELGNLFNSFIDAREDITTQKKLERQLNEQNQDLQNALTTLKTTQAHMVQQEKMAGIGQLAAGVAHEINNPLGFVTSNFSVLKDYITKFETLFSLLDTKRQQEEFSSGETGALVEQTWRDNTIDFARGDLPELIADTQDGLKRIAAIVNALKTFSRSSLLEEASPYDLNEGIKTTLIIANNEIKYTSTVSFDPSPIPQIKANGGQINQVILNIVINANQAIKQKQTKDGLITIKTFLENDYICCEIRDNGCGMTEDVVKRIFEPFFTTKPIGQGTGLGLSLAYDIIVYKHKGKIEASSQSGIGTRFIIRLPINIRIFEDGNQ